MSMYDQWSYTFDLSHIMPYILMHMCATWPRGDDNQTIMFTQILECIVWSKDTFAIVAIDICLVHHYRRSDRKCTNQSLSDESRKYYLRSSYASFDINCMAAIYLSLDSHCFFSSKCVAMGNAVFKVIERSQFYVLLLFNIVLTIFGNETLIE